MTKKPSKKPTQSKHMEFEPNKMTFAISAAAVVTLVLLALIVTQS